MWGEMWMDLLLRDGGISALPDLPSDPVWRGLHSCVEVVNPEQRVLDVSGFSRTSIQICFHLRCICVPQIFLIQG